MCLCFGIRLTPIEDLSYQDWPLLKVEFMSLKSVDLQGQFEFVDLPGIGENFDGFKFEEFLFRVAKKFTTIIPIVSYKEIELNEWKVFPEIIKKGTQDSPWLILCTHADMIRDINRREKLAEKINKVFWPKEGEKKGRILFCSSTRAFGAQLLSRISAGGKPPLKRFWTPGAITLQYDCAKEILGVSTPERSYGNLSVEQWNEEIEKQLDGSGLLKIADFITKDTTAKAQQRMALADNMGIWSIVRSLSSELKCAILFFLYVRLKVIDAHRQQLVEMRRTQIEFDDYSEEFKRTKSDWTKFLYAWDAKEIERKTTWKKNLQRRSRKLEDESHKILSNSLGSMPKSDVLRSQSELEVSDVVTYNFRGKKYAEQFLKDVHNDITSSLSTLRKNFVRAVRNFATDARDEQLRSLRLEMTSSAGVSGGQDTLAKLSELAFEHIMETETTITSFAKSRIDDTTVQKYKENYSISTAFNDLRHFIAKDYDNSGFMVRAPVTVVASFSLALSAAVLPFFTRKKGYSIKESVAKEAFVAKVIKPFVKSLTSEAEKTLEGVLRESSEVAKGVIKEILDKEENRYQIEKSKRGQKISTEDEAKTLACFINFHAAECALFVLQGYFRKGE
ncbi:hypothetical protein SCHPADRAFT_494584 [Schizopora paradoxa]|uniref:G domain-containing protein n=1 Tax=Schizopora paradoxa TaxID=27342 RepID=A0A0H2RNB2_9AGAM|nr:hypothetical protein SCHPADRAFT_494584 [Schizopora paradoxa]